MHFAFVPMTLARAVTVGTVLGYTVLYTVNTPRCSRTTNIRIPPLVSRPPSIRSKALTAPATDFSSRPSGSRLLQARTLRRQLIRV